MSDSFISYARATAAQAEQVAAGLRALGYVVRRDDELPAHRAYADVIEERLRTAKGVVVIWSADAAASEWVRSAADRARADRELVQLSVDGARLPMPFDQIQCADLAGWRGDVETAGWRKVAASIADLMRGAPLAASAAETRPTKAAAEPLLAVLAFDNLSGDPEMAYFSGGVSAEIQQTERASYANLFEAGSISPGGAYTTAIIFDQVVNAEMMRDVRFIGLCAKMGLCTYWVQTDRWPVCAEIVPYDFKAECRRLAS